MNLIKRFAVRLIVIAVLLGAAMIFLTRPKTIDPAQFAGLDGDAVAGESVFWAAGCASCHAEENDAARTLLSGGHRLKTDFGTFVTPNISPDPQHGIGAWDFEMFANSVLMGTSPGGGHYYPAYPYASYGRMTDQDVVDLWAFMQTLPASDRPNEPHEIGFPFSIRMTLGGWKMLFQDTDWVGPADTDELARGRYLVEALGHCAECHTPRNLLGGLDRSRWMTGAPNPSGDGKIPGLTSAQLDWSAQDIAYYLETGFTPDFDSAGGSMASVVESMIKLAPEDRAAIAAYIKALPPLD